MNLIITAKMGNGTIQAKLEPLSLLDEVSNIYFLRKYSGPDIPKVKYLILPKICSYSLFNILLTPLLLVFYTLKCKAAYILSYHVIPYAFFASFASFFSRKPYFVCQTGLTIQTISNNKIFWFFLKRILMNSHFFCVPGTSSSNYWISKGISASKIKLLHSTVDTDKYQPHIIISKLYDFIYIGRIGEEKRLDFLINAFTKVVYKYPATKLLILGSGPLLSTIRQLVDKSQLQENVFFAGFHKDVTKFLNQSKFIVLSSNTEGLPCAVMEGMSSGLVPVTTDVGNLKDIVINNKTGFLIEKDDITGFANAMKFLVSCDQLQIDRFSEEARSIIVKEHSHISSVKLWKQLLVDLNIKPESK